MQRDIDLASATQFDLLVVGGGIYGACVARDAALRGLSVLLLEQRDFGAATSHNSLKLLHGGFRYIQHLDFRRMRESVLERRAWMKMAPQLTRPLSCLMLTHGVVTRSRLALWVAGRIHELVGHDRNHGVPVTHVVSRSRVHGRRAAAARYPFELPAKTTGAAVWQDGQLLDADRALLACLKDAVANGATVVNHAHVDALIERSGRVVGAKVTDTIADQKFEVQARATVITAGPWVDQLRRGANGNSAPLLPEQPKTMNLNLVVDKVPRVDHAFGVQSKQRSDSLVDKESRQFFVTPWRSVTVIGTAHEELPAGADYDAPPSEMIERFTEDVGAACPELALGPDNVLYCYWGVTPGEHHKPRGVAPRARHGQIIDHSRDGGPDGVISLIGVKWTTARLEARRVVDAAIEKLGVDARPCATDTRPLPGASGFESHDALVSEIARGAPSHWTDGDVEDIAIEFGSEWQSVADIEPGADAPAGALAAKAIHAVDSEMAVRLSDVLIRRSSALERGQLAQTDVDWVAGMMADRHGWSAERTAAERSRFETDCRRAYARVRDYSEGAKESRAVAH